MTDDGRCVLDLNLPWRPANCHQEDTRNFPQTPSAIFSTLLCTTMFSKLSFSNRMVKMFYTVDFLFFFFKQPQTLFFKVMTTEPSGSWRRGMKWLILFLIWRDPSSSQRGGLAEQTESHISGWRQAGERDESRSAACEDILQGLVRERSSKAVFPSVFHQATAARVSPTSRPAYLSILISSLICKIEETCTWSVEFIRHSRIDHFRVYHSVDLGWG